MKKLLFENLFEYIDNAKEPKYVSTSTDDYNISSNEEPYYTDPDEDTYDDEDEPPFPGSVAFSKMYPEQTPHPPFPGSEVFAKMQSEQNPHKSDSAYSLLFAFFKENPDKWFTRKMIYDKFERKSYPSNYNKDKFHNATIEYALKKLEKNSIVKKENKHNELSGRTAAMWKFEPTKIDPIKPKPYSEKESTIRPNSSRHFILEYINKIRLANMKQIIERFEGGFMFRSRFPDEIQDRFNTKTIIDAIYRLVELGYIDSKQQINPQTNRSNHYYYITQKGKDVLRQLSNE